MHSNLQNNKIRITLPNSTFTEKFMFEEEWVEFFYTPGDSEDLSSCYDYKERILFVENNIGDPIMYIYKVNFYCYHIVSDNC